MRETELTVVGAGAAGLAVAGEAASHGVAVTVLDDNARPGGQYFRQLPPSFRRTATSPFDKDQARAETLLRGLDQPGITHLGEAIVWEAPEDGVLAFTRGAESGRVRARLIVVAAGAYDRPVPFPGWTLPGVMTAGGVQNLIKGHRVVPGGRIVVAGNGPLVLLVAANLVRAGAEVAAVAEAAPVHRRLGREASDLLAAPRIVRQAIDYRGALLCARVPFLTRHIVVEARGTDELDSVVLAPIDETGRIDRARGRSIAADTLVVGFGLTPSIEILRLLECELRWDRLRGGWLPVRSAEFETSRKGVLAVGDGAAIGGVEMALLEGRLAGLIAAERLGRLGAGAARHLARPLRQRLLRLERFRRALERLYAPPASYLDLLTPETIVCRCEEVTAGELSARQGDGYTSALALKGTTRLGMGRCQGRNCLATLAALVGRASGQAPEDVPMPRARPPARLITIGDLLHEPLAPPELPEDPHLPRGERVS
ncbi:MAG: FAD-dependent oxidoreductase [Alphaproteobacteria bacterium]